MSDAARLDIPPVRKAVTVPCHPEEAFRRFAAEMAAWWPLSTHSVSREDAVGVEVEPRVGGHIVETAGDGGRHLWGTITAWEPGPRLAFTWHPGEPESHATRVEVTFSPAEDGGTRVELVHGGWEQHPAGPSVRESYVPGWDFVLGRYAAWRWRPRKNQEHAG